MDQLIAQQLQHDPRIKEAKKLLLEAVKDHQSKLTGVKQPSQQLGESYENLIKQFGEIRGVPLWFPYLGSGIGNGCFVELLDGSVKYDFINGIGPHYLGHSHPALVSPSIDGALEDTVMQGNLQQNIDSLQLMQLLSKHSGLDHVFLTTSGAMANENAFKIAFQKHFPANRILAFDNCFAGRTLVLSQVTDKPNFRIGLPATISVDYIPFFDPKKPEESTQYSLKTLKSILARYPKQHAAMIFELVQGERGFYPGTEDFFKVLMNTLKDNNIAILIDEIQTFGRTSRLFAFQHFGLEEFADIVTVGKLSQVCATLYKKEFCPKPGLLSQTFTGSTSAIKAAICIIEYLLTNDFFGLQGKNMCIFNWFSKSIDTVVRKHSPLIEGPYGLGSMISFMPYGGDTQRVTQYVKDLFNEGVISFVAGVSPTRVRFLVPGIITEEQVNDAMVIVERTLLKPV